MEQTAKTKTKNTKSLFVILPTITLIIAFMAFSFFTKTFVFAEEIRTTYTKYTYSLDEVIVNLRDGQHYLKAKIALGYGLTDDLKDIEQTEVQIRDAILNILRSKSADDIRPVENTIVLKAQIKEKLNQLYPQEIIMDVYITDFLVQ